MTLTQRRIFMFSFILLFLIIAPIIVLFAQGYRFDKHGRIFVYSGSITIKGWPKDMDIYIDNEKQDKGVLSVINGSYTINSIRPGKYNLKCKKDGYTFWEKNIDVHSGVSTEFWNVLLFPDQDNQQTASHSAKEISQYFISPRNKNELVFLSEEDGKNKIYFINTIENLPQEIYSTEQYDFLEPAEKENVEWSSDNKKLLIPLRDKESHEKTFIVVSLKNNQATAAINFNQLFKNNLAKADEQMAETFQFEKVRWMFDKNEELVVLTKSGNLYYSYLDPQKENLLLDEHIYGFDFAGNRIYYCQAPNKIIWEIKNSDISTKRQIISQSIDTGRQDDFVKMIAYDEYRIAIIDGDGDLVVFNEEKEVGEKTLKLVRNKVKDIQFSDDGKKLLYWTENEIWVLMLRDWEVQPIRSKNKETLVTRFSEPIKNVQWMDNYENIIFSVDKTIKSAEIDDRDRINIVNIKSLEDTVAERMMFYDKQNQTLYFLNHKLLNSSLLVESTGLLGL